MNNQARPAPQPRPRETVQVPLPGSGQNVPVEAQVVARPGNVLPPQAEQKPPAPAMPDVEAAVEQIRQYIENSSRELRFSVQEDTGRTIIKVMDPNTGELIRAIPPEEVMAIASMIDANVRLINAVA